MTQVFLVIWFHQEDGVRPLGFSGMTCIAHTERKLVQSDLKTLKSQRNHHFSVLGSKQLPQMPVHFWTSTFSMPSFPFCFPLVLSSSVQAGSQSCLDVTMSNGLLWPQCFHCCAILLYLCAQYVRFLNHIWSWKHSLGLYLWNTILKASTDFSLSWMCEDWNTNFLTEWYVSIFCLWEWSWITYKITSVHCIHAL